jgi:hypothetical protein
VTTATPGFFTNQPGGDLRLRISAAAAIDKSAPLPEVADDWSGRPRDGRPDAGAHEWRAP